MLRIFALTALMTSVAVPALAQDIKQELEQLRTAYQDCVGKHDGACVASLYTKDGIQINPSGVFSDIKARYEENFKNGQESVAITTSNIWPLSNDLALAEGTADITRRTEPLKVSVYWGATYVREGGQMKVRMTTIGMKPPPAKEASADKK